MTILKSHPITTCVFIDVVDIKQGLTKEAISSKVIQSIGVTRYTKDILAHIDPIPYGFESLSLKANADVSFSLSTESDSGQVYVYMHCCVEMRFRKDVHSNFAKLVQPSLGMYFDSNKKRSHRSKSMTPFVDTKRMHLSTYNLKFNIDVETGEISDAD